MAERLVNVDRNTPMLLPVDMRDWVDEGDLVHFIIEAIANSKQLNFAINDRGTGHRQYPPAMMLGLLIYSYAQGIFSSRRIELATYRDVAVRFLTADTHPDHDTISEFRRQNKAVITQSFVSILELAHEMKLLKVGILSVDGTKIKANASKHRSVSYQRAGELMQQLELEVKDLLAKAEAADQLSTEEAQKLPQELADRQKRLEQMLAARQRIEERAAQDFRAEQEAYEKKQAAWEKRPKARRGSAPSEPKDTGPRPEQQTNLTDPDSRMMRQSQNEPFIQGYNLQLGVDVEGSQLILGASATQAGADNRQLEPMVEKIKTSLGVQPTTVLADKGYVDSGAIERLQAQGIKPLVAQTAGAYQKRKYDLRPSDKRRENPSPPKTETLQNMAKELDSKEGRRLYLRRQASVEPVFGIIKTVLGFRHFLLRGLSKVELEWNLVCLAYNCKRLHRLKSNSKSKPTPATSQVRDQNRSKISAFSAQHSKTFAALSHFKSASYLLAFSLAPNSLHLVLRQILTFSWRLNPTHS